MTRLDPGTLPIDELEPIAGEALALGIDYAAIVGLSQAVSLKRIADILERTQIENDPHFLADNLEEALAAGFPPYRHVAPSVMDAALAASRQIDPDLTCLEEPRS